MVDFPGETAPSVRTIALSRAESLDLLGNVRIGRVVFSHRALPAVRPVNHIVDGDHVVVRVHTGAALLKPARDGTVVAYEADEFDSEGRTGWSVVVTGMATLVQDPERQRHYRAALQPWIGDEMEHVVRISTDMVSGYRLG